MNPAPDTQNLVCRKTTPDGSYEIGVYGVLFGFRIRAGRAGSPCCDFDWCCGVSHDWLERMYGLLETAIDYGIQGKLPKHSEIKPLWNDAQFCFDVDKAFRDAGLVPRFADLPGAEELSARMQSQWVF